MKKSILLAIVALSGVLAANAQAVVDIEKTGAEKFSVSVKTTGNPAFKKCLERNLVLSGAFKLTADGLIKVTGSTGGSIVAEGRGKRISLPTSARDDKSARMEARRFADEMCKAYANQEGFARDKVAFVVKSQRSGELCIGYADGGDVKRITQDGKSTVGPRWKDSNTLFYTGYLNETPEIFEINAETGARKLKWSFRGLTTGAVMSPNGETAAIILSAHGNPELYVINVNSGNWTRLTKTDNGNEGQPTWSPDGRSIVYVSDETRRQHLYVIDVASKQKRRLTREGTSNLDPDYGKDGRIVYVTKRGGRNHIAVMSVKDGDKSARIVTEPGSWEHPTWSRDLRHVIAERDGALFLIDTLENGDAPVKLFSLSGKCITPSWSK